MIPNDSNILSLELAAKTLEPLLSELILVGGCAVGLLITDRARPPIRLTVDVDLLTEVTPLSNYYALCDSLRRLGFVESQDVICRWRKDELIIDVMPTDAKVLGFTNSWYELTAKMPTTTELPSGIQIRHITAPLLIATKIESFYGRGNGNYLHHDIEDIINLVDGRPELLIEIQEAPSNLREYIEDEIDYFLADKTFVDTIQMHLHPTKEEQERRSIILDRLVKIAGL